MKFSSATIAAAFFVSVIALPPDTKIYGASGLSKRAGELYGNWASCTKKVTDFKSVGCYTLSTAAAAILEYAVPTTVIPSSQMAKKKCYAWCKGLGLKYAAFLGGNKCYCGNMLQGTKGDSSQCNMKCNADGASDCGGSASYSVYTDPTIPTVDPQTAATGYWYVGCYLDDSSRIVQFPNAVANAAPTTMTIQGCTAQCAKYGYPVAGLQYAQQCFCGGTLRPGARKGGVGICNMLCLGDKTSGCGGNWAGDIYYNPDLDSTEPCR
ncbi:hypothetical protein TWF694_007881 [Orbilia ellipsospora]|uniref:WSC domain-containing protein n=1 Tax=Orbilia ellipsospora TaxID=2528407 RepID=A0AAV9XLL8_9PEZI